MIYQPKTSRRRARYLGTAAAVAMTLALPVPVLAQSTAELELLNDVTTILVTGDAVIDNDQYDDPSGTLTATASNESGLVSIGRDSLNSGAVSGSFPVIDNTIFGNAISNEATNTISAVTTPALDEQSAIGNLQLNSRDVTAQSDAARVFIDIELDEGTSGLIDEAVQGATLLLDGNAISVSATGNTAKNTIQVDGAVSIDGGYDAALITISDDDLGAGTTTGTTAPDLRAIGDLVIANGQINDVDSGAISGLTITADLFDALVVVEADSVSGSTIELTDNALSATAKGNVVTSTIRTAEDSVPTDPGARADIDAGLALANLQAGSNDLTVQAEVSGNLVGVLTGVDTTDYFSGPLDYDGSGNVDSSTITVADNSLSATAYNNQAVQTLNISANAVNADDLSLAHILDISVDDVSDQLRVDAAIGIAGQQLLDDARSYADVRSNSVGVGLYAEDNGVGDATIVVDGNDLSASAIGNIAVSSAIQIDANTVGTSVAVASVQQVSGGQVDADTLDNFVGASLVADVSGSTIEVTNNTMSSAATANLASSAIEIATNRVLVGDDLTGGVAIDASGFPSGFSYSGSITSDQALSLPHVAAGYAVLNNQTAETLEVTANTRADEEGAIGSVVVGAFTNGTVSVDGNDMTAEVRINEASTGLELAANDIDASGSGYVALGAVALNQWVDDVSGLAQSFVDVVNEFGVMSGDVTNSTISTSDNVVSAEVTGNLSTGTVLTLNVGNVDLDMTNDGNDWDADDDQFDGSFVVASAQVVSGGTLFATLRDHEDGYFTGAAIDSSEIRTEFNDDLTRSTAVSNDNTLSASVTGNAGVSTITIDATGSFDAQTGIFNTQRMDNADVDATIGVAGSVGSAGTTETADGIVVAVDIGDSGGGVTGTVADSTWVGNISGLTEEQVSGFLSDWSGQPDFSYNSSTGDVSFTYTFGTGTITIPYTYDLLENQYQFDISGLSESGLTAFQAAYPGATVVGTTASFTTTDAVDTTDTFSETFGATPTVDPAGGVFVSVGADISGSTIEIAGNLIEGAVTGNEAVNTVNVAALELQQTTDSGSYSDDGSFIATTIGILSEQYSSGSDYDATVFGTFAIEADVEDDRNDSTLVISANDQTATATANTARNVMVADVDTFNSTLAINNSQEFESGLVDAFSAMTVTAPMDLVDSTLVISDNTNSAVATANIGVTSLSLNANIANTRESGGATGSEDEDWASGDLVVFSQQYSTGAVEADAVTFIGNAFQIETPSTVASSMISLDGNATVAEATQNRATNTVRIDGNTIGSNAVLFNEQDADDYSAASAVSTVSIVLNAASDPTLDSASVSIDANRTSALAFGSVATNTMAINANQLNGRDNASVQNDVLRAQYGVVNDQDQGGNVLAVSQGTIYQIALNAEGATDTLASAQSSSSVINNVVSAQAVANYASNALAVTGLATSDVAVAVFNNQSNYGDVVARVGTTTIGISTTGDFGGMSTVGDNVVGATAVGNSATNLITR